MNEPYSPPCDLASIRDLFSDADPACKAPPRSAEAPCGGEKQGCGQFSESRAHGGSAPGEPEEETPRP